MVDFEDILLNTHDTFYKFDLINMAIDIYQSINMQFIQSNIYYK